MYYSNNFPDGMMTALNSKNILWKLILVTSISSSFLPVKANIDKEVAEFCLKASDFSGCVERMSSENKNSVNKNNSEGLLKITKSRYFDEEDFIGAINDLEQLIVINPKLAEAHLILGLIKAIELEEFDQALINVNKSVLLDKTDSNKYLALGYLKSYALERDLEGIEDLNKAINIDPENSLAYYFRGFVYTYLADTEENDQKYEKAKSYRLKAIEDYTSSIKYYKKEIDPLFKRLYPFGYLHTLYGERGNSFFKIAFIYKELKNKEMFKSSLKTALLDFDKYIEYSPTFKEVDSLKNPAKAFDYQLIKSAGNVWKGNVYSWQNKWTSACREWKKVKKTSSANEKWKTANKYEYIQEGFFNYTASGC